MMVVVVSRLVLVDVDPPGWKKRNPAYLGEVEESRRS